MTTFLSKQNTQTAPKIADIPAEALRPLPFAERDGGDLLPLAKSISQLGILEPLLVRGRESGCFEVICGQRRLQAAQLAGLRSVPCVMTDLSDSAACAARLSSILHSSPTDVFFLTKALGELCVRFRLTEQKAAVLLGMSRERVSRLTLLLALPTEQLRAMSEHGLTERHAAMIAERSPEERRSLIGAAAKYGYSPDELARYIGFRDEEKRLRKSCRRRAAVLSDTRLFFNTVERAVKLLRLAGVRVVSEKNSCERYTELRLIVPNKK